MGKNIYIVLSRTGTMFANAIAYCTKDQYSHVSLSLDPTFQKMYSFGRKIPEKMFPCGFVDENLYDGVFAMFPESKCLIYKIPVTDKQYSDLEENLQEFIDKRPVYKYSVLGTLRLYVNKPAKRENKYFCSQFVSEILINSGIYLTDKCPELIKPMDLADFPDKELVYEGIIRHSAFDGNYNRKTVIRRSPALKVGSRLVSTIGNIKGKLSL